VTVRDIQKTLLVIGLGNVGDDYKDTYHNMGFWTVQLLGDKCNIKIDKKQCDSLVGVGSIQGVKLILAKPTTFMNLSGIAVKQLLSKYKVKSADCLIIYDDIDLPIGSIRLRENGSAGTHNGMRSVINEIGTIDIMRLRIGIGKPPVDVPLFNFVTMKVLNTDRPILENAVVQAVNTIQSMIDKINTD